VYAKRTRDFIKQILEEDGLGEGTDVKELDVLAVALKTADPNYEPYSNDIRSRTLPKPNKIDIIDALSHKVECRSSQEQSNKLRRFLKKQCGVEYPSRYSLKAEIDRRVVKVELDRHEIVNGVMVPREAYIRYPDALRKSVIQLYELGAINQTTKVIELEIKDGLDGAGNQIEIRQQWKKMVTMGFVILKVLDKTDPDQKNVILWENLYPNSNFSFKPLSMILEDETYQLCQYLFNKYPKKQSNMVVDITENFSVNVCFKIRRCMVDGKLRGLCSGRAAAHCFSCKWELADYYTKKKHQAVTVHYISIDDYNDAAAGVSSSTDLFFRVLREGQLGCADAKRRMNYVDEPIMGLDCMTILHSVINCCKHMFNSLVIAECCTGLETLKPYKNMSSVNVKIRDAGIKDYAKKLRKKMGIVVRDIGHGNTGGGLVGNHAKAFFENADDICEKIFTKLGDYKEHFKNIIRRLYVILLILTSNLPVDIDKYQDRCRTTIASIQKNLPFFRFTPTLHTVLFHSWEHIQNHDCRGLGKYHGEDAVEMAMGRFRNARKFQAFRGDLERNMKDAFIVGQEESDYFLTRDFRKMKRSQVIFII